MTCIFRLSHLTICINVTNQPPLVGFDCIVDHLHSQLLEGLFNAFPEDGKILNWCCVDTVFDVAPEKEFHVCRVRGIQHGERRSLRFVWCRNVVRQVSMMVKKCHSHVVPGAGLLTMSLSVENVAKCPHLSIKEIADLLDVQEAQPVDLAKSTFQTLNENLGVQGQNIAKNANTHGIEGNHS